MVTASGGTGLWAQVDHTRPDHRQRGWVCLRTALSRMSEKIGWLIKQGSVSEKLTKLELAF